MCVWFTHRQVLARRQPPLWWPGWDPCSRLLPKNAPPGWHPLWLRWVMDPRKPHGWVSGWASNVNGSSLSSSTQTLFVGRLKRSAWECAPETDNLEQTRGVMMKQKCVTGSRQTPDHHLSQVWVSSSLHPLQARTFFRLLPMSLGTSWACSTPASRGPSCPLTTPSRTRWGWARTTSKASSICTALTLGSCRQRRPHLRLRRTQKPTRLSPMWAERTHYFNQRIRRWI